GPLQRAVDRDRARAQRKELAREPERLAHRGGRIEGAVVARAVVLDLASHHQPRKLLVGGELQERVVLVVPENDVVARPVLPHQRVGLGIPRARLLEVGAHATAQGRRLADVEDLLLAVPVEVDSRPVRHPGDLLVEIHDLYRLASDGGAPAPRRPAARTTTSLQARLAGGCGAQGGATYVICCLRSDLSRSRSSAACSKSSRLAASFIRVSSSPMRACRAAGDWNVSAWSSSTGIV